MVRKLIVVGLTLLVSACAGTPVYQPQAWAKVSFEQANAECLDAVQANPLRSHPRCMEAKGWKHVGYQ